MMSTAGSQFVFAMLLTFGWRSGGSHMDVSKNRGGPPKWMVKIMENPIKMDDLGVPLFLKLSEKSWVVPPPSWVKNHQDKNNIFSRSRTKPSKEKVFQTLYASCCRECFFNHRFYPAHVEEAWSSDSYLIELHNFYRLDVPNPMNGT